MQEISYLSDVDVKFSLINVLFSEINQMMSTSPVPVRSRLLLLPRVQIILSELNQFVMSTQKFPYEDDDTSGVGDSHPDPSLELEWDNYQDSYYHLYYNYEDGAFYSSDDDKEEDNNSCDEEECVIDDPTCREECVIDVPTCSEECVIDSSGLQLMSSTSAPTMDMRNKLLIAMMSLAPNSIYHAEKAKRRR